MARQFEFLYGGYVVGASGNLESNAVKYVIHILEVGADLDLTEGASYPEIVDAAKLRGYSLIPDEIIDELENEDEDMPPDSMYWVAMEPRRDDVYDPFILRIFRKENGDGPYLDDDDLTYDYLAVTFGPNCLFAFMKA